MTVTGVLAALADDPGLAPALQPEVAATLEISGPPGLPPFLGAALAGSDETCPVLLVTATVSEAEELTEAIASLLPPDSVALFPAWETLPHERLSPRADTVGRRIAVLRRLDHPDPNDPTVGVVRTVVAPVRAVLQPIVRGLGEISPVRLRVGDDAQISDVAESLTDLGYTRTDLVEKRSEFAVRGGILDVFPPTEPHPVRVEFWGDTVEEVRWFSAADQRSLEANQHGLWAPPVRELPLTATVRERAAMLRDQYPQLADIFEQLAEGIAVDGMEALAPVLADGMQTLVEALPPCARILVVDPERVRTRAHDLVATSAEFLQASWVNAALGNTTPIDLGMASYREVADVRHIALARGQSWWTVGPFGGAIDDDTAQDADETTVDEAGVIRADVKAAPSYRGDTDKALSDVSRWLSHGWRVVMVTEGPGSAARLVERLADADVAARIDIDLPDLPVSNVAHVTTGGLAHGLVSEPLRLAVLTESDLVGQRSSTKQMRRLPSRRRNAVDPLQLRPGDYVVHEQHGVGRYVEMVQRTVQSATREYLVIEYAAAKRGQPGDRLFVPTDSLDQVTRYVGGEAPTLHRLGGADWAKTKGRARKAVRQIAAELIRLYSARMASPGFAFSPDTPWQRELEDAFPYVETPDQLVSIDEVKADMERPVPMDRLICGDVGYGKTEIAVRAAFKAVQDGKQVAVLVPTTLLVTQHHTTFAERFANFPVDVKPLSRFQSDGEVNKTISGLADGSVDVVIGTHRLLQPSVRIKNLGLVVIDEEQRFGVEHKEYLKALRTHVDVLTMSATPIPRTLEMAVSGIRDMSTILTPPEERHPILTFVGPYDDKQVGAAIRRELLREGQVFYVHNRVESIDRAARRLRDLVPEARIEIAHGQMPEHQLEVVIQQFWEREVDVLVCTTIVENGLDISNANTLILERADALGLAQLHQLRGRVGRGRERGYAYFLYPPEKPLTETAHDRLSTIAQHTDLGAGMAVAMKDLEIRGAGNVLGGEQSGHVEGVGFDLYVRLVGEAVAELRSGGSPSSVEESQEVRIELPVDAHLPHEWIPSERVRMETYQRIAEAHSDDALTAVHDELVDRFGQLPTVVERLLGVGRLRVLARRAGVSDIVVQGQSVRFAPVALPESRLMRLTRLYPGTVVKPAVRTILVPRPTTARVGGTPLRDDAALQWADQLLRTIVLDESLEDSA